MKTSVVLSIGKEKQAWFIIPGLIKLSGGGLVSDPCTLFVETLRLRGLDVVTCKDGVTLNESQCALNPTWKREDKIHEKKRRMKNFTINGFKCFGLWSLI